MAMKKAEFHVHTRWSHDSIMGLSALRFMCHLRGISCLAITDHNSIDGAIAARDYLLSRDISVIVGEEIFTSEGEIIGLWLSERIEPGMTPEDTVREIRKQGGAVYIPHPFDEKRKKTVLRREALSRIAMDIDCVEIHNGRNIKSDFDIHQREIFDELHLVNPRIRPIIGCDAHCSFEVGRNWIGTKSEITRDCFPMILDTASFHASRCLPISHVSTKFARAFKLAIKGDYDALYRALVRKLGR